MTSGPSQRPVSPLRARMIEDLTPYLIGWRGYFGFCQTPRVLTNLEPWIRRRLRSYLWRQWQNGHNRYGFRKETIAGVRHNGRDAPKAAG